MSDFGELGQAKPRHEDIFGWFGVTIRVHPTVSDVALTDFMEHANKIGMPDENDTSPENIARGFEQMGLVKEFCRKLIHLDDFDTFWLLGVDNGYGLQDFMQIARDLLALIAQNPTGQPSDSSPGRPNTPTKSEGTSSAVAVRSPLTATDRKVKERLENQGRPDLALMVLEASEAKASRGRRVRSL